MTALFASVQWENAGMFLFIVATACLLRLYQNRQHRPWYRVVVTLGRDLSEPETFHDGYRIVRETTHLVWDVRLSWKQIQDHVPTRGDSWGEYEVENVDIITL